MDTVHPITARLRAAALGLCACVLLGAANPATALYDKARTRYQSLKGQSDHQQYRHHWTRVIDSFDVVVSRYPKSPEAPGALFTIAGLWAELYAISKRDGDLKQALDVYARVATRYPKSTLADDALLKQAELRAKQGQDPNAATVTLKTLLSRFPKGDKVPEARALLSSLKSTQPLGSRASNAASPTPLAAATTQPPVPTVASTPSAAPHIVIDPGHGGKDTGALTAKDKAEKAIALAIATRVAEQLRAQGFVVTLTRTADTSLSLSERTGLANQLQADAFVSIHANASRKPDAHGIETYYLDVTHDRYALKLAALENQTNEHEVSDLRLILADLATKVNTDQSYTLARTVQTQLVKAARTRNPKVRNLGVKPSLFYVLLGARMPAILIETGFVSHKQEGTLLVDDAYQTTLADAIAVAVGGHFRTLVARGE